MSSVVTNPTPTPDPKATPAAAAAPPVPAGVTGTKPPSPSPSTPAPAAESAASEPQDCPDCSTAQNPSGTLNPEQLQAAAKPGTRIVLDIAGTKSDYGECPTCKGSGKVTGSV